MSTSLSPKKRSTPLSSTGSPGATEFHHDLVAGDHVIRWTRIVIYPIQVHGVVLSAVEDAVTIVDFGVSSDAVGGKSKGDSKHEEGVDASASIESLDEGAALEDVVSQEDREMMKACENYEGENKRRLNIVSITKMEDIDQWKKVNYGETINKGWKWWWKSDEKDDAGNDDADADADANTDIDTAKTDQATNQDDARAVEQYDTNDTNLTEPQPLLTANNSFQYEQYSRPQLSTSKSKDKPPKNIQPPQLPSSDPTTMVLSRVRYLLHDPSILPPHNIFYSNSECIAVWCKTGRWSTLQASIFLHSTAAGQLKSAATLATVVGTTTITQIVPAGGIAGWFGMTTTTTVGLLSLQPWLIPVLAGYGVIAVGTPLFIMSKARAKWAETTKVLTDGFWGWADNDVFVDAVKSWSAVGSEWAD